MGNITCVSKARLGDYITSLTQEEMKSIDKALSISLGVNHYYQTLQNIYNDKLQYIEKLKKINLTLQTDLNTNQQQLSEFQELLKTYHFPDSKSLANYIANTIQKSN